MAATVETTLYETEFIQFLLSRPSLEAIANYHLSDESEERINQLLEANQQGNITPEQKAELALYGQIEHFITMLKMEAFEKN